ncbi:hypothetical protein C7B67_24615 [filamentous cyanobacterium Phorm 6]|nr:hypothetical protein C7B67_24615 [filamentous cyanobacterium Phorm 6]
MLQPFLHKSFLLSRFHQLCHVIVFDVVHNFSILCDRIFSLDRTLAKLAEEDRRIVQAIFEMNNNRIW